MVVLTPIWPHMHACCCVEQSKDAIERIVVLRMRSVGDRETENYVTKVVGQRFRNPDWGTINGLLGDFSDGYKLEWSRRFPSGERIDENLRSINTIKNSLAHTGTNSLHVTLRGCSVLYGHHYSCDFIP